MRKDHLNFPSGLSLEVVVVSRCCKLRIVVVYRLQYSPNHPGTTEVFFEEIADYLESIILSSES